MALADLLGVHFRLREALALGLLISLAVTLIVTPIAIQKLRGAGIVGRDRHKVGRPKVAEMGGLAVFVAFNAGAFVILAFGDLGKAEQVLVLASLVVIAGATLTGALDDLIVLQQRFKAAIPFAFAAPLALFVEDPTIWLPFLGVVDFGVWYPILLVPLGVACASNGFNMLEGFNGLGTGLGIISGVALTVIIILTGEFTGLAVLAPLIGALMGFWVFNAYPARIFPGDSLTLAVGAVIACAAILGKVEFWGAILLAPHIVEFLLKMRGRFKVQSFADEMVDGKMVHRGGMYSLTHLAMKLGKAPEEPRLVRRLLVGMGLYATVVVLAAQAGG